MSRLLLAAVVAAALAQAPAPQKAASSTPSPGQQRLAQLVAQGEGPYTKVADHVWTTPYRGKNMPNFTVRVGAAEDGIFFFVHMFDRKSITLSRNLLLKIAELNSVFDYAKIDLDEDSLEVRVDMPARLMDATEFKRMESQAATAADEAYGILRDFVQ